MASASPRVRRISPFHHEFARASGRAHRRKAQTRRAFRPPTAQSCRSGRSWTDDARHELRSRGVCDLVRAADRPEISFGFDQANALVTRRPLVQPFAGAVGRSVVEDDEFEIGEGVAKIAFGRLILCTCITTLTGGFKRRSLPLRRQPGGATNRESKRWCDRGLHQARPLAPNGGFRGLG